MSLRSAGCVYAEDETRLLLDAAGSAAELDAMVVRRLAGEPLEVIIGWAEFCGLRVIVEPGVFVPRRRTELLVLEGAALAPPRPVVLDLCCGSGALGVALATKLVDVKLYATDIDPAAVRCARHNITSLGQVLEGGRVFEGDLYDPLPVELRGRVDLMVVNAPYVPTEAIRLMPPEARDHEPRVALDGGPDGLDLHRRVAAGARQWLAPAGHVLIEASKRQAPQTADAFIRAGLVSRVARSEELDATVVIGTLPPVP